MDASDDTLEAAVAAIRRADTLSDERQRELASRVSRFGEAAIGPLVELLAHGFGNQRDVARLALIQIGRSATPALVPLLRNGAAEDRQHAARALQSIGGAEAVDALRRALTVEVRRTASIRGKRRVRWVLTTCIWVAWWTVLVACATRAPFGAGTMACLAVGLVLLGALVATIGLDQAAAVRRSAVSAIAESSDRSMAGVVALCLQDIDEPTRAAACSTLKRLLPNLEPGDAANFGPEAFQCLFSELGGRDKDLTIAILEALGQIGDERALPYVERFAHDRFSGWDPRVYQAANDALPRIRARAAEEKESRTLLRAASSQADAAAVLLRPAASSESQREQLLRPSERPAA